jgi:NAD(P)-dependent dehydrogenase (short-subunit alcohol dehydrogenase family)
VELADDLRAFRVEVGAPPPVEAPTRALLPALAADVHVVNVVSSAYTTYTGDPFTEPDRYVGINAYARAKLLHLLATMSLARQLGVHARVNAINPGMAWTPGTQALTPAAVPGHGKVPSCGR